MSDRQPPEGKGYDLQAVYAEKADPFWFRWDDQWWELPHPKMLDFEVQLKVESFDVSALTEAGDGEDVEAVAKAKIDELFGLIMGGGQATEWRQVQVRPLQMMLDMFSQWMEHSKAGMGESEASTDSSKSTGRPSKLTSTASTGSGSPQRSRARKAAAGPPVNS